MNGHSWKSWTLDGKEGGERAALTRRLSSYELQSTDPALVGGGIRCSVASVKAFDGVILTASKVLGDSDRLFSWWNPFVTEFWRRKGCTCSLSIRTCFFARVAGSVVLHPQHHLIVAILQLLAFSSTAEEESAPFVPLTIGCLARNSLGAHLQTTNDLILLLLLVWQPETRRLL